MDLFGNIFGSGLTLGTYLLASGIALICGLVAALAAGYRSSASRSLFISLVVLPFAVETVILMVNGSIGTGIAVAGAFSLVRFRSVPGKAKDIALLFVAMTAGIACASGYVAIALLFTLLACLVTVLIGSVRLSVDRDMTLRMTVPESLDFVGAFDDIFEQYTKKHSLVSVKNSNMGSLYKLTYIIQLKNEEDIRKFTDALRVRNGNLEISISHAEGNEEL